MRESRRTNYIILGALLMIAAAFAVYATMVMRWFAAPKTGAPAAAFASKASLDASLESARRDFREGLLDPRAHLRLSEALWKSGRPVDSFYVTCAARQVFSDEAFRQAHAEVVLGAGGPAAAALARLKGLKDPALAVPVHAGVARDYPDSPEGRDSLERLTQMAMSPDDGGGGDAARIARTALEELYRADPKNPDKLAALAGADFGRGDAASALALATEAWNKRPGQAGAARIMGMLALQNRDIDGALKWLSAAWDRNPNDLYSAAKLAQIYENRGDPESALPFYLALYRQNPDYADDAPAETRVRETLDRRREDLLKGVTVEGLGGRFTLDDASLRAEAALRAAAFKDPRWIDALGELMDDDTELVRRAADYALFQIALQEPGAVRARRQQWLGSDKPLVRIRALNLFADLDGANALPAVAAALRDSNPGVRVYAKLMVLDHYYKGLPEAAKLRARYRAEETDADALEFLKRFGNVFAVSFFDTHVHLGDAQFDADREDVLARALESGVGRLVEIADSPDEWDRAVAIARAHPDRVRCSLGLHPYYADRFDENLIPRLKAALSSTPEAVAIGEIGLDYAKSIIPAGIQRRAFSELLAAGRDWNVPLVIHCRDAYMDLVPMLRDMFVHPPEGRRFWGVVHCFSGTPAEAEACAALGFALGADGPVTYKKNDALREAFRAAGPDVAVLETDCPYLPPQSSRGKRNEPRAVPEIAARLAEVWSLPIEEVARRTTANASALYRWP